MDLARMPAIDGHVSMRDIRLYRFIWRSCLRTGFQIMSGANQDHHMCDRWQLDSIAIKTWSSIHFHKISTKPLVTTDSAQVLYWDSGFPVKSHVTWPWYICFEAFYESFLWFGVNISGRYSKDSCPKKSPKKLKCGTKWVRNAKQSDPPSANKKKIRVVYKCINIENVSMHGWLMFAKT